MKNKETVYKVIPPKKINEEITVTAKVPGSKSATNRAMLLAALANGESTVRGGLKSGDSDSFINCLKELGFEVYDAPFGEMNRIVTIKGNGGKIPVRKASINVGSAGTAARFISAMLAFSEGEYDIESSEQMKKRPMSPLIETLRSCGATVICTESEGHFPIKVKGAGDKIPDEFGVNIDESSQFLSALMTASGTLKRKTVINISGSHGMKYAEMTMKMMEEFGVKSCFEERENGLVCEISGGGYTAADYNVEPDVSAACYFYAMAAVSGADIAVEGVKRNTLQGDIEFLNILEKMGCTIHETALGLAVKGNKGRLKGGFTADMSSFSDQALTLAAIAPFADAPITITGIGHIRYQECDRIKAIVNNLNLMGIKTEEYTDKTVIYPGTPVQCDIETYDDHRTAMSFAVTGLRSGLRIKNPECCKKTFSNYFQEFERMLNLLRE